MAKDLIMMNTREVTPPVTFKIVRSDTTVRPDRCSSAIAVISVWIPFDDIPGIGGRMEKRPYAVGIYDMKGLLRTEPKQMRKIWRNVTGERLWYALHGYDIQAGKSERGMFGHGRVLPPDMRDIGQAYTIARMLLVKAARRMRNSGYYASRLMVWCQGFERSFGDQQKLPMFTTIMPV